MTFPTRSSSKAAPCGVYDVAHDYRLGECRHQPRHGRFRRGKHPALVAAFAGKIPRIFMSWGAEAQGPA